MDASRESQTRQHYLELPYRVAVKSEPEGEQQFWRATVEELSGCTARGATPDEAVERLRPAMEAWLTTALAEQREVPVPNSRDASGGEALDSETSKSKAAPSHSGRFLVRMPSELHEQLAREAESKEVSLNRFVTDVLAASLSPTPPTEQASDAPDPVAAVGPAPGSQRQPARALRLALATNLVVVVLAGLVAVVLLVLALRHGI